MTDWQLGRAPGRWLSREEDGHLAVPLWIAREGEFIATSDLVMTTAEAEQLHAALCHALDGQPIPDFAPDCRYPIQRSPSLRR